jgi:predicted aspartyl protease
VDTGFNGYLLWEGTPANLTDFPGELSPLYESVEVAGGKILANLALTSIQWLDGDYSSVETLVALSDKSHQPGDPVAFVGTALLSGTTLIVDFLAGTVNIGRT